MAGGPQTSFLVQCGNVGAGWWPAPGFQPFFSDRATETPSLKLVIYSVTRRLPPVQTTSPLHGHARVELPVSVLNPASKPESAALPSGFPEWDRTLHTHADSPSLHRPASGVANGPLYTRSRCCLCASPFPLSLLPSSRSRPGATATTSPPFCPHQADAKTSRTLEIWASTRELKSARCIVAAFYIPRHL